LTVNKAAAPNQRILGFAKGEVELDCELVLKQFGGIEGLRAAVQATRIEERDDRLSFSFSGPYNDSVEIVKQEGDLYGLRFFWRGIIVTEYRGVSLSKIRGVFCEGAGVNANKFRAS